MDDFYDNLLLKFNNDVALVKYFNISNVTAGKYLNSDLLYYIIYRFKPIQDQSVFYFSFIVFLMESELVSGFMTEHSAVIFVFFFLAEYASIVLICILNSILFLGGYLLDFNYYLYPYFYLLKYFEGDSYMYLTENESNFNVINFYNYSTTIGTVICGIVIGLKACIMIFIFI
jgi:hypothetical protein